MVNDGFIKLVTYFLNFRLYIIIILYLIRNYYGMPGF